MRKVKLEDLKKGVEIQWYEHGRKYIIESVDGNYVVLAGYNVSVVSLDDVLKNCYIKGKEFVIFKGVGYCGLTYGNLYEVVGCNETHSKLFTDNGDVVSVSKQLLSPPQDYEHRKEYGNWKALEDYIIPEIKNGYPPMSSVKPIKEKPLSDQYPHYYKDVSNLKVIDVYRVLELFEVNDPCIQHAIKKLLAIGNRGVKDHDRDFREVMDTLKRYKEMRSEDESNEEES